MTIANVFPRAELIGLARKRKLADERVTIKKAELTERLAAGWSIHRKNKLTAVISRPKRHDVHLEDRVWMLIYKMGFPHLSGAGGAVLTVNPNGTNELTSQIDVLGIDEEVVIAIECKSAQSRSRRGSLQEELAKHGLVREALGRAVNRMGGDKRTPVLALWTYNARLSANDRERAREQNITLLDGDDLAYYESLTNHLGRAARYQFLADLVPGKRIPGLSIRVPALKAKMGGYVCYTFAAPPDYLLKIAYVSHRARGHTSDVSTYQRMVSKSRLRSIARYISEPDAIFPTNIVINLETGKKGSGAQFERARQEEDSQGATFGWLTLKPTYKSAWVIDGQHRLFAYSDHPRAASSSLSVLAFEGLPGSVQQKLFIDINAEQKRVKKSLLQELYADLHKTSDDPSKRTQALISAAIQNLDDDPDSPFYDRILLADSVRTESRCISLNGIFSALDKPGFYYGAVKNNVVIDPGPFWSPHDEEVVRRSIAIVNGWFDAIRGHVPDWWDAGAGEGGGLAMNDGVTVCINVLRSVADHLNAGKTKLADLSVREVMDRLGQYADALGEHLGAMTPEQRLAFRALRGVQGQTAGTYHAQHALHRKFAEFEPEGLQRFLEQELARTSEQASALVLKIERLLSATVIAILKEQFGADDDRWWYDGVPKSVRTPVAERQEEDDNRAGSREAYLDLIHYRLIIANNWSLLGPILGYGKSGDRHKKTEWLVRVNDIRKVAMHASRGASVSFEQLSELDTYLIWLQSQVGGLAAGAVGPVDAEDLVLP